MSERVKLEDVALKIEDIEYKLTDEQRAELDAARERVRKRLVQPDMQPEAIRARMEAAAKWEQEHGDVSAFCGERKDGS
jgi:hypothetical protein